jgi:outer membrane lipoprotein carrier protein
MRFIILIFAFLSLAATAHAETAEQLANRVQGVYDKVPSYMADFQQESILKATGQSSAAKGKVAFKKPGKMRWDYESPVSQAIISDGKTLWIYQPNDRQVLVSNAEKFLKNRASITFLAGKGKLTEEFNVKLGKAPEAGVPGTVLELIPKQPDASVSRVLLIVDPKTALVTETWVYDFLNNATRVRFTNAETGRKLNDALFVFTAPPGIDVIKQ